MPSRAVRRKITQEDFNDPCFLKTIYVGEEVWIGGKGPSFDYYDWEQAGEERYGINEAVLLIPKCKGAFSLDYNVTDRLIKEMDKDIILFRKNTHRNRKHTKTFVWTAQEHSPIIRGTSTTAVQVLHTLGARKMHFIGFDSIDGCGLYGNKIRSIKGQGINKDCFKRINEKLLQVIADRHIECIWEHRSLPPYVKI